MPAVYSTRAEARIPVSKATLTALKSFLRGGEAYDTLIRRMLITGIPKSVDRMSDAEKNWVMNEQF
jgi:hypothetical protein